MAGARWHEGYWVLGFIERVTTHVLVQMNDRSAESLLLIIARHVLLNTRIITEPEP